VSRRIFLSLPLLLVLGLAAAAQSFGCFDPSRPRTFVDPSRPREPDQTPDIPAEMQHKQIKAMNQERQTSLKKDTDKLLQLATELKQRVDKTNENQLSLEVKRKRDEVE
jgi:hypothetical protein